MDPLLFKAIRVFVFWNLILAGGLYTFFVTYAATMRRHGEAPSMVSVLSSANMMAVTIGLAIAFIGLALFIREFKSAI